VKATIGGTVDSSVHVEPARVFSNAIEYCKKDGDYREFGEVPVKPGQNKDKSTLREFMDAVKAGERNPANLRELFPSVMARYRHFCADYIRDNRPVEPFEVLPLRPWQVKLEALLKDSPDSRSIIFIVGEVGNEGKSYFTDYIEATFSNTVVLVPGKKADMASAFANQYKAGDGHLIVIVDAPRSKQGGCLQYSFLEELKNKRCFVTKFDSRNDKITLPHVVVMMNELPDRYPLSDDRYLVFRVPGWEPVALEELPDRREEAQARVVVDPSGAEYPY
jgi:hypothetical protein